MVTTMGNGAAVEALPKTWRERSLLLKDWAAADGAAKAWEQAAAELEECLARHEAETLNLQEAAAESGFSADHLGRLVRLGRIPNAGRKNAPRIRRKDLPRKTGTAAPPSTAVLLPRARSELVRSVLQVRKAANDG